MQETYTFSRALHLMRYGGKKMQCTDWAEGAYGFIDKHGNFRVFDGVSLEKNSSIQSFEIMGSWVEVH